MLHVATMEQQLFLSLLGSVSLSRSVSRNSDEWSNG